MEKLLTAPTVSEGFLAGIIRPDGGLDAFAALGALQTGGAMPIIHVIIGKAAATR